MVLRVYRESLEDGPKEIQLIQSVKVAQEDEENDRHLLHINPELRRRLPRHAQNEDDEDLSTIAPEDDAYLDFCFLYSYSPLYSPL